MTDLRTGASAQVNGTEVDGIYPAWSPDGGSLAFCRRFVGQDGVPAADVRITSVDGSQSRTLWQAGVRLLGAGLSWSPDGRQLALSVKPSLEQPFRIMLLDVDRRTTRWLHQTARTARG